MIRFNGKAFLSKEIVLKKQGQQKIATDNLKKELFRKDDETTYISDEAKNINEQIFFYVSVDDFLLSDKELEKIINISK